MKKRAALLNAMANSCRLQILILLRQGELPVGKLVDAIGISQSALSQHLAKLRAENLVTTRRDSQTIYYSTNPAAVNPILVALDEVFANRGRQAA